MKLRYWVWKILISVLLLTSLIFFNLQFPAKTSYFLTFNIGLYLLLLSSVILIKPKWDLFITFIYVLTLSFYTWGQTVYLRSFGQLAYINTAFSLKDEAAKSLSSIFEFIKWSDMIFALMPMMFVIVYYYFRKTKFTKINNIKISLVSYLSVLLFSFLFLFLSMNSIEASRMEEEDFFYYKTDHYLFNSKPSSVLFVEKFGLNMWLYKDIYDIYVYPLVNNNESKASKISEYLSTDKSSKTSELNGIFEGKSLLLIEAESLNNYAIDPVLTPTLYGINVNGYRFPNYNSPLLLGSTSDAELMVNTGLMPPNNGYVTFLKYYDNVFPTTLAKEFNDEDYYSIAAHNNYGEFYNRDVIYPNFGYTFFDCIDMGFDTQFIDDSKYIEVLTWILIEKPQFLSYWITFNGHQPYNTNELSEKIAEYLTTVQATYPDIPYEEQVFLAKNMDLDRGLSYLIEVFTYMNRIDDLVIIIYGDHAPKGIFTDGLNSSKDCSPLGYTDEQCLNTPLIVWHKNEFVGESLKIANPTDISPTIYDLFGIEYDQSSIFGTSVFSKLDSGFYFDANGNIRTQDYRYWSDTNEIEITSDMSQRELELEIKNTKNEMDIFRNIIEIDYYKLK